MDWLWLGGVALVLVVVQLGMRLAKAEAELQAVRRDVQALKRATPRDVAAAVTEAYLAGDVRTTAPLPEGLSR